MPNSLLMKRTLFLTLLCAALVSAFGCARFSNPPNDAKAERLVVISQTYNEIIWALGAQDRVVGVDLSSTYPPDVKRVQTVGYHRALSAEGILSLRPTAIIHDNNIGPPQVVEQLKGLNIPMKTFDAKNDSIDGVKALVREMGAYFHKEARAEELCKTLDTQMAASLEAVKKYTDKPRVAVIHFGRASNVYLVVGRGSGTGDLLDLDLAIDRIEAHAELEGAHDVALLLDRVAEGDAVGRGAGGEHHLDLGDRGGVEAGAEQRQRAQDLGRRIGLHGVEHARVGQGPGELGVVVAHDLEVDDHARAVLTSVAQEFTDALSHGALPTKGSMEVLWSLRIEVQTIRKSCRPASAREDGIPLRAMETRMARWALHPTMLPWIGWGILHPHAWQ